MQNTIYTPAALATRAAETTSNKYLFIPTAEIIAKLESEGFKLHRQREAGTRKEEMKGFTKHVLTFHNESELAREARKIGDSIPEIGIVNSHNGGGSLRVYAGLFRLICTNGMVVGDTWDEHTYPHRGNGHTLDDILSDVFGLTQQFSGISEHVQAMQAKQVAPDVREEFARQAALLRWEEGKEPVRPDQLLRPRRFADNGTDAWSTFNVVQENLIKGQTYYNRRGQRKTRAVSGLDSDLSINRRLYGLAQTILA